MILDTIIKQTQKSLPARMHAVSRDRLIELIASRAPARDFARAISGSDTVNIIAEAKKASPSRGVICSDFDPVAIARCYEEHGARAVSVLTEERHFQGSLAYLSSIREAVDIPVLRKDFIIDPYQVYEARAAGADAVLLIAAVLDDDQLADLGRLTGQLGMHALVEIHTLEELNRAVRADYSIIGINNRNLNTFETDIEASVRLRPMIPDHIITVSESGIHTARDISRLRACGFDAFLIGESLMRDPDPGSKLSQLLCAGS